MPSIDKQTPKQVAVVGGGIIGICTAYFLAAAGHEVALIERRASVAEEASFGHAGIVAPACVAPWASPGMSRKLLASLFQRGIPNLIRPDADRTLWRWLRQSRAECEAGRYLRNRRRMLRLAAYSQQVLQQLTQQNHLEYEQSSGLLQLFRSQEEVDSHAPARALLAEHGVPHELLDAAGARRIEPALAAATPLAAALHLPDAGAGNCALFAKQLRQLAQSIGAQFHFLAQVDAITPERGRIALAIGAETVHAEAVVVAAGAASARLLRPLGIDVPLQPVQGYSLTVPIKEFDAAPRSALIDDGNDVAITRLGKRLRIAGLAELGARNADAGAPEAVLRTLARVGNDWFPGAASYHGATLWSGPRPMLPDGAPLLGRTPIDNLFINLGHGSAGWAMAAGSGRILADLISGRQPEIDLDGLTLARRG